MSVEVHKREKDDPLGTISKGLSIYQSVSSNSDSSQAAAKPKEDDAMKRRMAVMRQQQMMGEQGPY